MEYLNKIIDTLITDLKVRFPNDLIIVGGNLQNPPKRDFILITPITVLPKDIQTQKIFEYFYRFTVTYFKVGYNLSNSTKTVLAIIPYIEDVIRDLNPTEAKIVFLDRFFTHSFDYEILDDVIYTKGQINAELRVNEQ